MTKPTYKEREFERREQEILSITAQMLRTSGYANISMENVAAEVGISKPTLYRHFNGKEEMVSRAIAKSLQQLSELIDQAQGEPISQLETIFRQVLQRGAQGDSFAQLLTREVISPTLTPSSILSEQRQQIQTRLRGLVSAAKTRHQIIDSVPEVIIVTIFFSLLSVLETSIFDKKNLQNNADVVEVVTQLFLRSITPR